MCKANAADETISRVSHTHTPTKAAAGTRDNAVHAIDPRVCPMYTSLTVMGWPSLASRVLPHVPALSAVLSYSTHGHEVRL